MLHLEHSFYGADTWTFRKIDQICLRSFEIWCWGRMDKISWTNLAKNEGILLRVDKEKNILHAIKRTKANWTSHILCRTAFQNTLLKEWSSDWRRGRGRKQVLDVFQEKIKLSEIEKEALDRNLCRIRFGRGYGLSQDRQRKVWMTFCEWFHLFDFVAVNPVHTFWTKTTWKWENVTKRILINWNMVRN
jgi:hypothetical protein